MTRSKTVGGPLDRFAESLAHAAEQAEGIADKLEQAGVESGSASALSGYLMEAATAAREAGVDSRTADRLLGAFRPKTTAQVDVEMLLVELEQAAQNLDRQYDYKWMDVRRDALIEVARAGRRQPEDWPAWRAIAAIAGLDRLRQPDGRRRDLQALHQCIINFCDMTWISLRPDKEREGTVHGDEWPYTELDMLNLQEALLDLQKAHEQWRRHERKWRVSHTREELRP